jgi:DNA polymerase III alpha subunit
VLKIIQNIKLLLDKEQNKNIFICMFAELSIISNFTFLTGASHPEEYMMRAALLGLPAIAITDVNSVTGIVRAYTAARDIKRFVKDRESKNLIGPPRPQHIKKPPSLSLDTVPRLIPGSKFKLIDGFEITVLPKSHKGWGTLCRCLSKGRLRNNKGLCDLVIGEISEGLSDVVLLIHPPETPWDLKKSNPWLENSTLLKKKFNRDIYIVMTPEYDGIDPKRFKHIKKLSKIIKCDLVASAHPIMHHSKRRKLADVLTAIRLGKNVEQLGKNALPNAERRLRSYTEIVKIFSRYPEAINNTIHISDKLQFSLDELRYQ